MRCLFLALTPRLLAVVPVRLMLLVSLLAARLLVLVRLVRLVPLELLVLLVLLVKLWREYHPPVYGY